MAATAGCTLDGLRAVIARHWGFREFRPLQEQAMRAVLEERDSLVVLPTGGGKSLCYQAPAVARGDTTVVISPLIALMKDQVDSLRANGVAAAQIDSSLSDEARRKAEQDALAGKTRLLFASPERLVMPSFQQFLKRVNVRTFAVDEAHCISHWGHDFRPEYRQLNRLKEFFPGSSVHGYTATATERVRQDIVKQLGLDDAEVLVGNFDRPNLTYRIVPRRDVVSQVREVIDRHRGEPGIIYCLRRKDVDELAASLQFERYKVIGYHAGMSTEERRLAQDAFKNEQCDIVVATIAFGMGIDRSNVRYVLHTALPKSIEHYQQETGRAGRDGLEAECVLLYSPADAISWKKILDKSAADPHVDPDFLPSAKKHLDDMDRYCQFAKCRHRALVEYFGQRLETTACGACDVCLEDMDELPDGLIVAQKILSCVARMQERFGVRQLIRVLRGEKTHHVLERGHEKLSTFGLLKNCAETEIRDWVYQMLGQQLLIQTEDEYPVLKLNPASWEVMRSKRSVRLLQPSKVKAIKKSTSAVQSWKGVDADLFQILRELRKEVAESRGVPPFVIFSDATLRALAAIRPSTLDGMRYVKGVGDQKLRDYGDRFIESIDDYCREKRVARDVSEGISDEMKRKPSRRQLQAHEWFRQGKPMEDVIRWLGMAPSTVNGYLRDFIRMEPPPSIHRWVPDERYRAIALAVKRVGGTRLKPVFEELEERYSYDEIGLVMTHLQALGRTSRASAES